MTVIEKYIPLGENGTAEIALHKPVLDATGDIAIPHNLNDLSTYSKFLAIYTRDAETNKCYSVEEKQNCKINAKWDNFVQYIEESESVEASISNRIYEYNVPATIANQFTNALGLPIKISEHRREGENQIRGCVTTIENENDFNDWFIFHILEQARLGLSERPIVPMKNRYHEVFADYFEANMKNTIIDDQWDIEGRQYFIRRVRYFTDRYLKIECVLPAFPCKSSNFDKVAGDIPDKGEEFALKRLIKVTQDAAKIYPPGMKIWIVSDGHVFSDCIGVNDDVVNSYTAKLHQLYESIAIPGVDAIGFCGLNDLFFNGASASKFNPSLIKDVQIGHFTGTKVCSVSDVSRAILMKGCDTDDGRLRKQINIDGHPRLNLYRGFSRFMMEDLIRLPYFENTSRKGFKKVVSKIAFNMIRRNDAYSNLVELIFPHHMRLSIHAHTNSGPKFGIKVISSDQCQIVRSLSDIEEPKFEDLLHIPTPWHNCVVKLNSGQYFLTKSKVVKDAMESGSYKGEWKDTRLEGGEGGYYVISKCE